ncbi:SDR family oxidoreductase [Alphaproteobacteria bacterium]|nr:SDR family oxidoreductase [Alphaproteobacteria bacterium]
MNLDFLTNEFLIKDNQFDAPIVVTGAGGCIGSWILAILHRSNIPCVAIDLSEERTRLELLLGEEASKIKWHKCDITDFNSLKKIILSYEPSAIVHLAGLQVPFCAANPALGARVNVEGTINILEIAKEVNIKRTVYASSVAALGMPPKGPWKETLYGAYKLANEHTAYVYWADWQTPSIGLRPNIVYGLARDQGMSSKNTVAIQAAALDKSYKIPYTGKYSWLYAGEAALAFITSVSKDMVGSHVFNLNGSCETIENGLKLIRELKPNSSVTCEGQPLPFPPDLDDLPLRKHIGDYTSVSVQKGIEHTIKAFETLKSEGKCPAIPI